VGHLSGRREDELLPTLRSTDFGIEDLTEWRKGGEHALRKTPQGYLGDPAASNPEFGEQLMAEQADIVAEVIAAKAAAPP
jgi:creatinine amidohydrolase